MPEVDPGLPTEPLHVGSPNGRISDDRPAPEPSTGQLRADHPDTEQPDTDQPRANEPGLDRLRVDQPGVDQPGVDRLRADQPRAGQPGVDRQRPDQARPDQARPDQSRPDWPRPDQRPDSPGNDQPHFRRPPADRFHDRTPTTERLPVVTAPTDRLAPVRPAAENPADHTGDRIDDVRKIVVLRCNALGDLLMSLPALAALASTYPEAELTLLGARWHAAFLPGRVAAVHRVQVLPEVDGLAGQPGGAPPASELGAFLDAARAERYDLAVQLHGGGTRSNPLVTALGARVTVGLRADDAPPLDRTLPYRYYQPEQARYLEVVSLVGARPGRVEPVVSPTAEDERQAERLLAGVPEPRVALHVGATDPRRRWPLDRFAAVAKELVIDGVGVVAVGAKGESLTVPGVLDLAGRTDLGTLAAVLRSCTAVIGNDSGPLHLARAVGTGTVGLYWCGNAINAAPDTRLRHRPLLSWRVHCAVCGVDCTPVGHPHRPGDGCAHQASFLDQIPVAEVLDEVRSLLEKP